MRKDKKQQKNAPGEQLKIFSSTGEPLKGSIDGIDKPLSDGVELLSRLESQRTLTRNLLEKIVDYENLKRAFAQVRANDGSSGVDGMAVEELRQWLGKNLNNLRDDLLNERYAVSAVRKVEIPKGAGGTRMLGIPTVKDRFIQQAIHQELSRHYEPHFSEHS